MWNSGVQLKVKEREMFRLNLLNVYLQVADRYAKKIRRHPMQMLINCCSEGDNRGASHRNASVSCHTVFDIYYIVKIADSANTPAL